MPWRARANTAEAARSSTTTTTLALLTWSLWLLLRARSAAGAEAHAAGVEASHARTTGGLHGSASNGGGTLLAASVGRKPSACVTLSSGAGPVAVIGADGVAVSRLREGLSAATAGAAAAPGVSPSPSAGGGSWEDVGGVDSAAHLARRVNRLQHLGTGPPVATTGRTRPYEGGRVDPGGEQGGAQHRGLIPTAVRVRLHHPTPSRLSVALTTVVDAGVSTLQIPRWRRGRGVQRGVTLGVPGDLPDTTGGVVNVVFLTAAATPLLDVPVEERRAREETVRYRSGVAGDGDVWGLEGVDGETVVVIHALGLTESGGGPNQTKPALLASRDAEIGRAHV